MHAPDTHPSPSSELETLVDSWGLGTLDPAAAQALEVLAAHAPALRQSMSRTVEAAAAIGAGVAVPPPPRLRDRLAGRLNSLAPAAAAAPPPAAAPLRIVEHQAIPWEATPYDGVTRKPLYHDPAANLLTSLISLRPGAVIPAHAHDRIEQCFVLEGELLWGEHPLPAGHFAAALEIPTLSTPGGSLLLVISPSQA
jgi:hypothetical protein